VFIGVVGAVAVSAGVYAVGYTRRGVDSSRTVSMMLPLFVASMLLVPAAAGIGAFLVCWEFMAVTSLLLVLAEHRRGEQVASAGRWYAVMTHLGFVAILLALVVLGSLTGDGFAQIREQAGQVPTPLSGLVFVLLLVGFGSKAGIVPLHAWLPRAHPEAPSHVSALMSAAMVTMGVYGIARFGLDLLHGGARWWWLLVLVAGGLSAIYGILQAAMSSDVKRLLGFSTTENMGLVLVGVGAAGLFAEAGDGVLAGLAMTAALLHVINHAAFKTVLFEAAGSVLHATGTRDLDALGGLRARMPATTLLFGVGAFAGSALPLGPAFVSEWLLLQALVHGFTVGGVATAIVMPVAVAAVALTAGLAVATFVKAFGVGFLARPRSAAAAGAHEGPIAMSVGMGLAAVGCVGLGVAPVLVLPAVGAVSASLFGSRVPVSAEPLLVGLDGFTGALSPLLVAAVVLGAILATAGLVRMLLARRARVRTRLWDCGAGPLSSRMEYTATSFAEPLQRVFDNVIQPEHDVEVTHHRESRYLVEAVNYRLWVADRVEHRLYGPILRGARWWARAGAWVATGSVHRYLGYGFVSVCLLFVVLVVVSW
jgi:formate hydrogenlyase subunit 3/multisubunit Na+/H+ antiporter MnhD subunit